jgi:hypothetical protein
MPLGCNWNKMHQPRVMKQQRSTMQHDGTQDPAPTAVYETATFNDATCTWDVTSGTQDPAPTTACCMETATLCNTCCM